MYVYVNDAAPANTEVVAGFSLIANAQSDKDVIVVDVVVPAHAPLIGNLGVTNIVSGSIYAGALAIDETFAGAAAPGRHGVERPLPGGARRDPEPDDAAPEHGRRGRHADQQEPAAGPVSGEIRREKFFRVRAL